MHLFNRFTILTASLGLALGAVTPAHATDYFLSSNGPDKCAAFTPGVTNTVRNRVSGTQNVGASPIAVACVFELKELQGAGTVTTDDVSVYLRNDSAVAVDVSCTMLPGSGTFGTAETKVVALGAGGGTGSALFNGPYEVYGIGINCTLPSDVTIYQTIIRYSDANP